MLFPLPGTCFPRSLNSWLLVIWASAPMSPLLGTSPCPHSHDIAQHCYLHGSVTLLYFPISCLLVCCPFSPLGGGAHGLHPAPGHRCWPCVCMCVDTSIWCCCQGWFGELDALDPRPTGILPGPEDPSRRQLSSAENLGDLSLGCPGLTTSFIFINVVG